MLSVQHCDELFSLFFRVVLITHKVSRFRLEAEVRFRSESDRLLQELFRVKELKIKESQGKSLDRQERWAEMKVGVNMSSSGLDTSGVIKTLLTAE